MQKSEKSSKLDSASLIDLKAELFRKQEEFKAQRLQSQNAGFIKGKPSASNKKPCLFSKRNTGVDERAEKDYEEKVEEENVFERSRKALENKAKLYEQIASGTQISDEDGSGVFLVDFQKKNIDDFEQRLEHERKEKEEMERREIEEEQRQLTESVPPPESEEEEWVDYVDAFGRSRRCLRKDLQDLQKQDEALQVKKRKIDEKKEKGHKDFQTLRDKSDDTTGLLSDDMRREMERQKWEKGELEKMQEEKQGPIHYSDVLHREIRTHGVGFYKFAKDEDARQEQMEQLNQLRQETKDERSKSERIKEKRKAALAARLAKVKQRKREKLGLPDTQEDEEAESDEEIGPKFEEQIKKDPEPLTRDDSWRVSVELTREWDKGKQLTMERSEEAWLEKQRAEREEEFAPPSIYFNTPSAKTYSQSEKSTKQNKKETAAEKFEKETASEIEKHLKEIRKNICSDTVAGSELEDNLQTDTHTSIHDSEVARGVRDTREETSMYVISSELNLSTQRFPSDVSVPDTSVPPPNFNVPPPNYHIPTPGFYFPPPNLSIPPPNVSVPPPNYGQPNTSNTDAITQPARVPTISSVSCQSNTVTGSTAALHTAPQIGESHTKVVPKMRIMDTRLVESENS